MKSQNITQKEDAFENIVKKCGHSVKASMCLYSFIDQDGNDGLVQVCSK